VSGDPTNVLPVNGLRLALVNRGPHQRQVVKALVYLTGLHMRQVIPIRMSVSQVDMLLVIVEFFGPFNSLPFSTSSSPTAHICLHFGIGS